MISRRGFLGAGAAVGIGSALQLKPRAAESGLLMLNSNENPRGLSASCRDAVRRGLDLAGRYPFSRMDPLYEKIAKRHRLTPKNVILGNGSSEVIQMAVQALLDDGMSLVTADPTFDILVGYTAGRREIEVRKIPLRPDFSHDLAAMKDAASANSKGALVYICNPNNPTATLTSVPQVRRWVENAPPQIKFLVDEAYFEYVDDPAYESADSWVDEFPQLVVTRTFSKVFGMAGLRLGYGLAHAETAERINAFVSDVNINHMALVAGLASLDDAGFERESVTLNRDARQILLSTLDELGIGYLPSHTNFVMYEIKGPVKTYVERMKNEQVLVGRPFPPMQGHNRVTIGLPAEMRRFVQILRSFRQRGWV